jgi:hypothetical protein
MAEITNSVRAVDEIIPPIIGKAMRCIILEPVPVLQRMGTRPAMMVPAVIIFGKRVEILIS